MNNLRYLIPFFTLLQAIMLDKGVEFKKLGNTTSEEMIWISLFLLVLGIAFEYFEYETKEALLQDKTTLAIAIFCKFVMFVSLGYLMLYWADIYNNDFYFSMSILFISCGGTTRLIKLKRKKWDLES